MYNFLKLTLLFSTAAFGGNDLAAQLAGATLKRSQAAKPTAKPAISLQDEMRMKLERRKAKMLVVALFILYVSR